MVPLLQLKSLFQVSSYIAVIEKLKKTHTHSQPFVIFLFLLYSLITQFT